MKLIKQVFKVLNKFFMVPAYRMGLGPLISNPLAGYIMVIKNTGRKSGKLYYSPTNYAILDGKIYCMAGFGRKTHWYLNIMEHPEVELILPGRAIYGTAAEVIDPHTALKACEQILKNAGFAGFFEGYNPHKAPEEAFRKTLERAVPLEVTPTGIGSSPLDAHGWHWVPLLFLLLFLIFR